MYKYNIDDKVEVMYADCAEDNECDFCNQPIKEVLPEKPYVVTITEIHISAYGYSYSVVGLGRYKKTQYMFKEDSIIGPYYEQ